MSPCYTNSFFFVAGTCSRVWTSIHCSPIVRYAIKRGKLRTAEVTWTMGGKLLRLLLLLCAAVALLCSLASAEQGRMTTEYSCSLKLRVCHLWCVDCVCACVCVCVCVCACLLFVYFGTNRFYRLPAYWNHCRMSKFWPPNNGTSWWHVINPSVPRVIQSQKRLFLLDRASSW